MKYLITYAVLLLCVAPYVSGQTTKTSHIEEIDSAMILTKPKADTLKTYLRRQASQSAQINLLTPKRSGTLALLEDINTFFNGDSIMRQAPDGGCAYTYPADNLICNGWGLSGSENFTYPPHITDSSHTGVWEIDAQSSSGGGWTAALTCYWWNMGSTIGTTRYIKYDSTRAYKLSYAFSYSGNTAQFPLTIGLIFYNKDTLMVGRTPLGVNGINTITTDSVSAVLPVAAYPSSVKYMRVYLTTGNPHGFNTGTFAYVTLHHLYLQDASPNRTVSTLDSILTGYASKSNIHDTASVLRADYLGRFRDSTSMLKVQFLDSLVNYKTYDSLTFATQVGLIDTAAALRNALASVGAKSMLWLMAVDAGGITMRVDSSDAQPWNIGITPYSGVYRTESLFLHNNILYVCSYNNGVFKSTNYGLSWAASNSGLPGLPFYAKAITCRHDSLFLSTSAGVYRSVNDGASWSSISASGLAFPSVILNPKEQTGYLYEWNAGSYYVTRSADFGAHWTTLGSLNINTSNAQAFAVNGLNSLVSYGGSPSGIKFSSDGCLTWGATQFSGNIPTAIFNRAGTFLISNTNGIYRSTDGTTWTKTSNRANAIFAMSWSLSDTIWTQPSGSYLMRSTTDGVAWDSVKSFTTTGISTGMDLLTMQKPKSEVTDSSLSLRYYTSTVEAKSQTYLKTQIDTVGTVKAGVWNGTSIDTAYTNAVSQLTAGANITLNKYGKGYKVTASGGSFDSTSLSNRINLKQNIIGNISDTLLYAKKTDTVSMVMPWKLGAYQPLITNLADTSKYLEGKDTLNLYNRLNAIVPFDSTSISNRINLKMNLFDTTVYKYPLATKQSLIDSAAALRASIGTGGGSSFDSTSISNRINLKQNIIPNLSDSALYAKKTDTLGYVMPWRLGAYQPKGIYTVPGDTTLNRTYSTLLYQPKVTNLADTAKYIEYADTTLAIAKRWQFGAYQLKITNIADTSLYGKKTDTSGFVMPWELGGYQAKYSNITDTSKYMMKSDSSLYMKASVTTLPIVISIPADSSFINLTDTIVVGSYPQALVIDSVKFVNQNTSASVAYKLLYGTNLQAWTVIYSGTSTSVTIGDKATTLTNFAPLTNSYFALMFSTVTTKPKKAIATIYAHQTTATPALIVVSIPLDSSAINLTDTTVVGSLPYAWVIDSIKTVNQAATASVVYKILFGTNITSWTAVVTSPSASTSVTIGDKVTSLNNTNPAANSYFAVLMSTITTKPRKAIITIFGHSL
jgi:hypothetical protein